MASSKFIKWFNVNGTPLIGAAIWLVPQANTYPTGALALTEDTLKAGTYYRDDVPDGEYKIYIDVEGGTSPTLWEEEYYVAEARLTEIADHFDAGDSYRLETDGLKDGAVTTVKIADLNVTADKLATDAVTTAKIADGNVTTAKILDANVTTAKIADSNVTTAKIADGNVTTAKILDANVTTVKIADSNVTTAKIADGNVTTAKILDANVTTVKIADSNVTTAKIANGNVTTAKIADDAVTVAKMGNMVKASIDPVTTVPDYVGQIGITAAGRKYVAISLTDTMWELFQKIDNSTIVASSAGTISIGDGSITAGKIANSAISYPLIQDWGVTKEKINPDVAGLGLSKNADASLQVNVDGSTLEINSDTVRIKDGGVTGAKLASAAVGIDLQKSSNALIFADHRTNDSNNMRVMQLGIGRAMATLAAGSKLNAVTGVNAGTSLLSVTHAAVTAVTNDGAVFSVADIAKMTQAVIEAGQQSTVSMAAAFTAASETALSAGVWVKTSALAALIPAYASELIRLEVYETVAGSAVTVYTSGWFNLAAVIMGKEFSSVNGTGTCKFKIANQYNGYTFFSAQLNIIQSATANGAKFRLMFDNQHATSVAVTMNLVNPFLIMGIDEPLAHFVYPETAATLYYYNRYAMSASERQIFNERLKLETGKNLVDYFGKIKGTVDSSGNVTADPNNTRWYTPLIAVSPSTAMYLQGNSGGYLFQYTSAGVFISRTQPTSFTTASNCAYVRVYNYDGVGTGVMLEVGSSASAYRLYEANVLVANFLDNTKFLAPRNQRQNWYGKTVLCIGDSVTVAGKYQYVMAQQLGLATVNMHAKAGITMLQAMDGDGAGLAALSASDLTGVDLVTVFCGLNDRDKLVGSVTDMYPTNNTIAGHVNYAINKIYTLAATAGNLGVRIVFVTPHKCGKYSWIDADGGQVYPAGSGQTLETICNMIISCAGRYGLPVVDLYHNSGINNYNWTVTTVNTGGGSGPYPANNDNVHPNDQGHLLIGRCIAGVIESI